VPLTAAEPPQWFDVKLKDMEVKARLLRDRQEIARLLGNDLDGDFILIEVNLKPLYGAQARRLSDAYLSQQ
jgi:hypothetical protein